MSACARLREVCTNITIIIFFPVTGSRSCTHFSACVCANWRLYAICPTIVFVVVLSWVGALQIGQEPRVAQRLPGSFVALAAVFEKQSGLLRYVHCICFTITIAARYCGFLVGACTKGRTAVSKHLCLCLSGCACVGIYSTCSTTYHTCTCCFDHEPRYPTRREL